MNPLIIAPIIDLISKGIDRWIPDPEERAKAQIDMVRMAQEGQFKELEASMRAIMAEAQSADPWTSRSRPMFLYVFYVVILALVLLAPLLGIFYPERMDLFFLNVGKGFGAIPEELWWTFTAGYLGYAGLRTREKEKGVSR